MSSYQREHHTQKPKKIGPKKIVPNNNHDIGQTPTDTIENVKQHWTDEVAHSRALFIERSRQQKRHPFANFTKQQSAYVNPKKVLKILRKMERKCRENEINRWRNSRQRDNNEVCGECLQHDVIRTCYEHLCNGCTEVAADRYQLSASIGDSAYDLPIGQVKLLLKQRAERHKSEQRKIAAMSQQEYADYRRKQLMQYN